MRKPPLENLNDALFQPLNEQEAAAVLGGLLCEIGQTRNDNSPTGWSRDFERDPWAL